ncbi:hypothetical protein SAMN05216600_11825 [Pseudomonas cuatrocienegasensis]|uniref:Uncharacterized protein n=1 Tax=Pseudomonas cuatrocienegasensis TaxID=543360 RepID=A0ABY1BMU6_9PSED|nr:MULTISPECIES: hypothetical protein [Pseudomonas]OEC32715.1 hypothetical protein A7D25_22550 [Pseudomonas sp. 21C1]SER21758.1 hypothetical protein SAMN05216600_11825 [Pseudomonas cuatrocienegasensis]
MKLHKVLSIAGKVYPLVKDDVRLDLRSPGRASFTIKSEVPVRGLVLFDLGYNERALQRHFIGHVERCTQASSLEHVLFCRELTSVLALPLPMNLRHVDMRQVLGEIAARTGLRFRVPDKPYAKVKAPYFYSLATGFQAMDSLAQVFGTWLGSEGVNVLQVVCDLIDLVQAMNTQLAAHTHVPGPTPSRPRCRGLHRQGRAGASAGWAAQADHCVNHAVHQIY